jgi:transcriptional regulator with XRE-family HTH domain
MPRTKGTHHLDVQKLYTELGAERRTREMSWRDMAIEMGVGASTFSRMRIGHRPDVDSLLSMLKWLGCEALEFAVEREKKPKPVNICRACNRPMPKPIRRPT